MAKPSVQLNSSNSTMSFDQKNSTSSSSSRRKLSWTALKTAFSNNGKSSSSRGGRRNSAISENSLFSVSTGATGSTAVDSIYSTSSLHQSSTNTTVSNGTSLSTTSTLVGTNYSPSSTTTFSSYSSQQQKLRTPIQHHHHQNTINEHNHSNVYSMTNQTQQQQQTPSKITDVHSHKPSIASSFDYGLVSKGHQNSLQTSEEERQKYFDEIQTRFLQLTITTNNQRVIKYAQDITVTKSLIEQVEGFPSTVITIDNILMQLRILREAILSLKQPSEFQKNVLIYSILVSAVYGHYQTYIPSFLTLLNDVLPELLETSQLDDYYREPEFQRVCTIYIYHLVHFANDCSTAFQLLGQYYSPESPIYEFIGTWVDKDYFQWRRSFDKETDPALHRVMAFGELAMAKEALSRVGTSYLKMEKSDLESVLGMDWNRLVKELDCEWTLEGSTVMIRKRK